MASFRSQLRFGLAMAVLPPAAVAGLYFYGVSTGCSGGDCTGAMFIVGLLGLIALLLSFGGVVWTAIVLIGELFRILAARVQSSPD